MIKRQNDEFKGLGTGKMAILAIYTLKCVINSHVLYPLYIILNLNIATGKGVNSILYMNQNNNIGTMHEPLFSYLLIFLLLHSFE